jgi:penicillin-binding protein 1A
MLETVLQYGTARAASLGQFAAGKTGTTSNFGDAWFIGWDSKYTVAVWVGFPNSLVPMTTQFNGKPVMGGTFPALIWHDFITSAMQVDKARAEHTAANLTSTGAQGAGGSGGAVEGTNSPSRTATSSTPPAGGGATGRKGSTPGAAGKETGSAPATPTPERTPAPATPPATPPASNPTSTPSPPATTSPPSTGGSPTGGVSPAP